MTPRSRDVPEVTEILRDGTGVKPFSFGSNWENFVQANFTVERLQIAKQHILQFLQLPDLKGKYFLDIGCGSGLSSYAALEAGAERVVSFDLDPISVKTTRSLQQASGITDRWAVLEGSILDRAFLERLDPADVAYSWGVLHHTGAMWEALRNAASLVKRQGCFYVALYLTTTRSSYWLEKKKAYNRSGSLKRRAMEYHYILRHVLFPKVIRMQNPLTEITQYRRQRGMNFMTDVRDWLGGYPYEDASIQQVIQFCRKELGLYLENIAPTSGLAEYLFRPQPQR